MSNANQNEINFDGLTQFLKTIGFDQSVKLNNSLVFHHRTSGTIVTLSIPDDGQTVRSADLLSIAMRLESQALIEPSKLSQFKSGKLPMAS